MSSFQQLIRILLQIAAGYVLGDAIANSSEFQTALSGLISFATFAWWYWAHRKAIK
jgi:membrane protein DedA with SNARE-associated domain